MLAGASIAIGTDGFPVIGYARNIASPALLGLVKIIKCGNAACSSGNTVQTVATEPGGLISQVFLPESLLAGLVPSSVKVGTDGRPVLLYALYDPLSPVLV